MGGVEDQLGRAVVLLELDDRGVRPVALEVEDVAQVRAAPRVDRLVVVADHAQVAVAGGQRPDPQVLRPVRVLVLVDVEVAPALLVLGQDVGRLVEQPDGLEQEVVEVERVRPCAAAPGSGSPAGRSCARGGSPRSRDRKVGSSISFLARLMAPRTALGRNSPVSGMSSSRRICFISDLLVVGVVDDEAAVRSRSPRHRPAARARASEWNVPATTSRPPSPTRLMIRSRSSDGGPVGEGDRQDPPRGDVLDADQVGDPMGEDAGLARSGAGQDQQRTLGRRHGACLLGVQRPDDLAPRAP